MAVGNLPTATPVVSDPLGQGYQNIANLADAIADRLEREHVTSRDGAGQTDREGLHSAGSAVAFYQDSAPLARHGTVLTVADRGLVWIKPMPSMAAMEYLQLHIYDGSAWKLVDTFFSLKADTIQERTVNTGVTIDGLLIKDNEINTANKLEAATQIKCGAVVIDTERVKCKAFQLGTKPTTPQPGDIWME